MSHDGTLTPAESAVPKLLDPEDDVLSDSDLPDAWMEDVPDPLEADCEDKADFLLQTRYKPMTDVQDIIAALQKHPISMRSTDTLYALAENTQMILRAWQDQYLELDAKVIFSRIATFKMVPTNLHRLHRMHTLPRKPAMAGAYP